MENGLRGRARIDELGGGSERSRASLQNELIIELSLPGCESSMR